MFRQTKRHLINTHFKFYDLQIGYTQNWVSYSGLEKSATLLSGTSRFSCWASNLSFSPSQLARYQASHLPTKSLKEQTKTCPGQANLRELYLSKGQAAIQVFFKLCYFAINM